MNTRKSGRQAEGTRDPRWPKRGEQRSPGALQQTAVPLQVATLGSLLLLLLLPQPSAARDWRGVRPGGWGRVPWVMAPPAYFSFSYPYSSAPFSPPVAPLSYSYDDPNTGMTYCLSTHSGIYYMCGYSRPTSEGLELARMAPPPPAFPAEQRFPAPSGVLLFRLPQDGEATVDGVPVGLSGGLGVTSVAPGQHQILVRASGSETEHTVTVRPHAILMVTPTAIAPTEP